MRSDSVVVIGAGHAGLAASRHLTDRSLDHVVLERGEVAHAWRHERWDSLRLLTPNWLSRLPGDPDGYATAGELADHLTAAAATAPVRTGTTVESVRRDDDGYLVRTDRGDHRARAVVLATGACSVPVVPPVAAAVPPAIDQVTSSAYRNPDGLRDGGVLVVGASATGVQLAAELARSGHPVVLATGEHTRMPRRYRDRDVLWWMDAAGVWDQRHDQLDDLERARRLPSPQLAGVPYTLDLNALTALGVELVGRLAAVRDGVALFSGGLRNVCALADLKLNRLLATFDEWAGDGPGERFEPTAVPATTRLKLDLTSGEITTIVWATGYRPDHSWLDVPVLDAKGRLRHDGGVVTESPGLYALGLPVLRRRKSTFLHGIDDDAHDIITHLACAFFE